MGIGPWVCFVLALFPMWKMCHTNKFKDWVVWYALAIFLVMLPPLVRDVGSHYAKKLETISASSAGRSMVSTRVYSLCALPGKEIHSTECSSTAPHEKAILNPYSPLRLNTEGCESERSEASKADRCE